MMKNINKKYNMPSEFAEIIGRNYSNSTSEKHKKLNGQFFTPKLISDFMGNLAKPKTDKISILDPGCGTGILSCSVIEKLILKTNIEEINLTLYEIDEIIIKDTEKVVLFLTEWLQCKNINLNVEIINENFVFSNSSVFDTNSLFDNQKQTNY